MTEKDAAETKKEPSKKSASKKESAGEAAENVTVADMYELLSILRAGLESRDKALDYLQEEIRLDREQIAQNKKIIAKRGVVTKLILILLAIGVLVVGFDQHTIVRSFDKDMTNVSNDMDVMLVEMTEMKSAMVTMSKDINSMSKDIKSMSGDFSQVAKDVNSISYGVHGMSYDTRQMNRQMDTMTPPWSPFK